VLEAAGLHNSNNNNQLTSLTQFRKTNRKRKKQMKQKTDRKKPDSAGCRYTSTATSAAHPSVQRNISEGSVHSPVGTSRLAARR
jgi:hypothetical protein